MTSLTSTPEPVLRADADSLYLAVYFGRNDFVMDGRSLAAAEQARQLIGTMHSPTLLVDGFASGEGKPDYNFDLSERRREAVITVLLHGGVGTQAVWGEAFGEGGAHLTETALPGPELERQRSKNRKVMVFALPKEQAVDLFPTLAVEMPPVPGEHPFKRPGVGPYQHPSLGTDVKRVLTDEVYGACREVGLGRPLCQKASKAAASAPGAAGAAIVDQILKDAGASPEMRDGVKRAIERYWEEVPAP